MPGIRPFHVCITLAIAYLALVWAVHGTPLAWVTLGEGAAELDLYVFSEEGYDGQFTYFIAQSPRSAAPRIDVPAYRYQRILLPALGWLLSFGVAALIPFALVLVNLLALGVGVALLESLLTHFNVSPWYSLGYGLSLGVLGTVRLALPEVLAYTLCIVGIWLIMEHDRLILSALPFALAALSKETTLLVSGAVGLHLLITAIRTRKSPVPPFIFGATVLLPFIAWQLILWTWLGSPGVGSGGRGATAFEPIPLMGVIRILTEGSPGVFITLMAILVPAVLLPTFWGLWQCVHDVQRKNWTLTSSLLLLNAAIMLFVPFSTYREPVGILRFIVGLQLALILYAADHARGRRRPLRYSTLWALTLLILLFSDLAGGTT